MRVILFVFMLWAFPAIAQENLPAACKLLSDHNNVVYQPGVDVDGNAVAPADLNASPMGGILNIIKVPLEFDLAQRISGLNIEGVKQGVNHNGSSLGMLEVHQTGKVMYNGQDITRPMMNICAKSHKEVSVEVVEVEMPKLPEIPKIEMPKEDFVKIPNNLAVTAEQAIERPSVSAPIVEKVQSPKVSTPAEPKLPLTGTPRNKQLATTDAISGQDFRDYNE